MKYFKAFCLFAIFSLNSSVVIAQRNPSFHARNLSVPGDSLIQHFVNQVSPDSIKSYMLKLESFRTRYVYAENRETVIAWLLNKLRSFGYTEAKADSFIASNGIWGKNIFASLSGTSYPDIFCITGAHYDSFSYGSSEVIAPGADDNASGTAAVLEMARIAKLNNFSPGFSLLFVFFGAEERGLLGSKYMAETFRQSRQKIKLMINQDMIAYAPSIDSLVGIFSCFGSDPYAFYAGNVTERFTNIRKAEGSEWGASDHLNFGEAGFPAISFTEFEHFSSLHSQKDSVKYLNISYCSEVTKASFATLLKSSVSPFTLAGLQSFNVGDGSSIHLKWHKSNEADLRYYNISIGRTPWQFDSSLATQDTSIVVTGLSEDSLYYFGLSALNSLGQEGVTVQISAFPSSAPYTVRGLTDSPERDRIILSWLKNTDEDLVGYNLYRSIDTLNGYVKLNSAVIKDTVYTDSEVSDTSYFYYVTSIDDKGNESFRSNIVESHPITMSHGVLIVDDTREFNGDKYSDAQIDSFYTAAFTEFYPDSYDMFKSYTIKLSDLGKYKYVIWHSNDNGSSKVIFINKAKVFKKYLDYGGNFLYAGFRASDFSQEFSNLSNISFKQGDFIYDYLKIKSTEVRGSWSTFIGALPATEGYPALKMDNSKTSGVYLPHIKSIWPTSEGRVIYSYESASASDSMKGLPVGVEYVGNTYKVICLNFPLFYMNDAQAKSLLNYIMKTKFNYTSALENNTGAKKNFDYYLEQNYPNPFNPVTSINYSVSRQSLVELRVFDILGREVETLVNKVQNPGVYKVQFDASKLPSGIYIYNLQAGQFRDSKKLMLLK